MHPHSLPTIIAAAALAVATAPISAAQAQDFPARTVTMVVPFPAGGSTDIAARLLGQHMAAGLKGTVVIENRAGAGGAIGIRAVAHSAPDGHTLGVSAVGTTVVMELLGQKIGYVPETDLVPVGHMGALAFVLGARPDLGADDLPGLIRLAKASPGKLTYASAGNGTPSQLAIEHLKLLAGIDIVHAAYAGNPPIFNDLAGRHLDLGSLAMPGTPEQVRGGKIKALAVTSAVRAAQLPEVPTVAEAGFPGFAAEIWNLLVAPKGTPAPVVERLGAALDAALEAPEIKAQLAIHGIVPVRMSPAETAVFVRSEHAKWAEVIKRTGIRGPQ